MKAANPLGLTVNLANICHALLIKGNASLMALWVALASKVVAHLTAFGLHRQKGITARRQAESRGGILRHYGRSEDSQSERQSHG